MYRVHKLLSMIGYCSRRSAERLIESGQVTINSKIVTPGDKWFVGDELEINGVKIDLSLLNRQEIEIIKYHKRLGEVVSRDDPFNSNTVFNSLPDIEGRWISIGRLDKNSSGLLLFTNNGELANKMMHPSSAIEREYIVETDKMISKDNLSLLCEGVPINNGQVGKFNKIINISKNIYSIILSTGKNREIRNSLKYIKHETQSLKRVRYSDIKLDDLQVGEYRYLSEDEKSIFLT